MPFSCSANQFWRRGHDVVQAGGALGRSLACGSGAGTSMPGLAGQLLDRVHERQAALVGEEADRVAMRAAAEAMVEALLVVDGEARRLLVVERAAGLPLAAGLDQLDRGRDDRADSVVRARSSSSQAGRGSSTLAPLAACERATPRVGRELPVGASDFTRASGRSRIHSVRGIVRVTVMVPTRGGDRQPAESQERSSCRRDQRARPRSLHAARDRRSSSSRSAR